MSAFTPTAQKLLAEPNVAILATLMPDGSPHTTAVWVERSGEQVVMATTTDTLKYRNLAADRRVGLAVLSREDPYLELNIRGHVIEIRPDDGKETIDRLSAKYYGVSPYPYYEESQDWVTVVILVDRVRTNKEVVS